MCGYEPHSTAFRIVRNQLINLIFPSFHKINGKAAEGYSASSNIKFFVHILNLWIWHYEYDIMNMTFYSKYCKGSACCRARCHFWSGLLNHRNQIISYLTVRVFFLYAKWIFFQIGTRVTDLVSQQMLFRRYVLSFSSKFVQSTWLKYLLCT